MDMTICLLRIQTLVNMDTSSLIGVMVWGNMTLAAIIYAFKQYSNYSDYQNEIRTEILLRIGYTIGYFLLFMRDALPDILSVNIGNTIIFFCFYNEFKLLTEITHVDSKTFRKLYDMVFAACIAAFNIVSLVSDSGGLRVGNASLVIFLMYALPAVQLVISRNTTRFKRSMGLMHIPLLIATFARAIFGYKDYSNALHINNIVQTLFFLCMLLHTFLNTLIFFLFIKEKADEKLARYASCDELTGLYNRRHFTTCAQQIICESDQSVYISILFIDIDYFKNVNDTYGHDFGDLVLIEVANALVRGTRSNDLRSRYGGEEFVVLLVHENIEQGQMIANRIFNEIKGLSFPDHPELSITASIGLFTTIPEPGKLNDYISKADQAMYLAKENGRAQIITITG